MPLKAEEQILSTTPTQESPMSTADGQPQTHTHFKQDHQMILDQPSVQDSDKENREGETVVPPPPNSTLEHPTETATPTTTTSTAITTPTNVTKAQEELTSNSTEEDKKLDDVCVMEVDGSADESQESTQEDLSSIALMVTNQIVTKVSTYLEQNYYNQPHLV